MKKQWISVKCGLSRDPKHRQAMGESVWLFLHMLDTASWEDGICHNWKDEAAAEEMGMPVRTLREHRRKLDEIGYITCRQKQYTQDIVIHNWTNPREYNGQVYNQKQGYTITSPQETEQGYTQGYTQGSRKHVTPTYNSNNQISIPLSIENAIATNQPVTEEMSERASKENNATRLFEKALGFSKPLPWWNGKEWTAFGEWVVERHVENPYCFGEYNIWRNTPFKKGGMANTRIRGFVNEFYDSWDMFMMSKPQKQTDETSPAYTYKPYTPEEEAHFTPPPPGMIPNLKGIK